MKTIVFIFLIALTAQGSSQIQETNFIQQLWIAAFGGDNLDAMAIDNAGNVYVTGRRVDLNYDWGTIKYNSAGERLWFTDYIGNHSDIPHDIAVDDLGNVYVTGESDNISIDYLTIKYNSQGVKQWEKRYGGNGNDVAYSIALDEDGNVYVTGSDISSNHSDCVTVKYTPEGTLVWEKIYNGPSHGYDKGTSVAIDQYGSVYVAGQTENSETDHDYLIIKYNSSGVQQWIRTYNGAGYGNDVVREMIVQGSAVYITGYSAGEGTDKDYMTLKYGLTGSLYYAKRYDGPVSGEDKGESLVVDNGGNAYVTGYSMSNTGFDYATVKYNSSGTFQWVKREDGGNNYDDKARDIALDEDGDIYVTGVFKKTDDDYQLATVKYSPSGTQKWIKKYINPTGTVSEGSFIIVDRSENIFIGGMKNRTGYQHGFHSSFLIVKYTQSPYVIQNRIEMPSTFSLSQNYPNPFNPVTNIEFSLPADANTKLIVYDITGKQVDELVNAELTAGTYKVDFDASHLATGAYFYRLESGNFTEVKKMVLVK